jgi:outer membrane protein OmpA-like peptidoglycan-associated protein
MKKSRKSYGLACLGALLLTNILAATFGADTKMTGVIVEKSAEGLTVRDYSGRETRFKLTAETEIKEKKKNVFRKATQYSSDDLLLGLAVEVKGQSDQDGALFAKEIKFTQDDFEVADSITTRVQPLETQLSETQEGLEAVQEQLAKTEQEFELSSRKVDAQLGELDGAFEVAKKDAQDAQLSANRALTRIDETEKRVTALDEYKVAESLKIQFGFDSAALPEKAKGDLTAMAQRYSDQRGYLIEVIGFASSDGSEEYNRRLSQRRAEAVVRFLAEEQNVPMRRIVTPHGFGENKAVGDNSSPEGREMNRRVEVKVLLNQGLASR